LLTVKQELERRKLSYGNEFSFNMALIHDCDRYTMEGDLTPNHGTFSELAGMAPRVLYALFDQLGREFVEFSVRCSHIEIYNEELRDLNAPELAEPLNNSSGQPMDKVASTSASAPSTSTSSADKGLKIYDDKTGTGVLIQGLQEITITSAEEGLKVLKRGSERRQIAATKCNEHSRCLSPLSFSVQSAH
jgi:kinesin family protein 11